MSTIIDGLIRVNRSIRPTYPKFAKPEWINSPMFIALEQRGPSIYNVCSLTSFFFDEEVSGETKNGERIDIVLESNKLLSACIGLHDLKAIQEKGVVFYREHFEGKEIFAWKSRVEDKNGCLLVPYLREKDSTVVLRFRWMELDWNSNNLMLLFGS